MEGLTPEQNYRFAIIEAIDFMKQSRKELFVKLVNVAMASEWSDLNEIFDENETISLDIAYFQECDDENIHRLYLTIRVMDKAIDVLLKKNNIQDNELGIKITF